MLLSKNLHEDNFKKYWDESAQFYKLRLRVYKLLIWATDIKKMGLKCLSRLDAQNNFAG